MSKRVSLQSALVIPGLVAAFSLSVSPVSAQKQASILEEIVVSARKRDEALHDVPNAITVLQEEDLRRRGITELNQVEKFAPNVVQTNFGQGNTGHAAVFMRGTGVQDHIITTDPSVGIYLDGVYLGRNMGANMDLMNIERVEVARGPQGSLSGRNTLGGALHIITREPAGDNSARLDIKAGSLGRIDGHLYADVALAETLSAAVSAGARSRNGIGKAVLIEDPDADIGEIRRAFGRVALLWEASGTLSFLATADLARSDQGIAPHAVEVFNVPNSFGLRPEDQPADPDDTFSVNDDLTGTEDRTLGVSLTADWNISDRLSLKAILSYRDMWYEGGLDNEKVRATLIEFPERGEAEQTTVEIHLSGVAGWGDWVAGFYAFDEDGFNDSPFVFRAGGLADGRPEVIPTRAFDGRLYLEQETRSRAGFGHANIDLGERWVLGLGARYTHDKKDALASLHYYPAPAQRRNDWDEFSGDAALSFRIAGNLNAYFSYARGYQAGGYPPRPFAGAATFVAFDPTVADSFELGAKGAWGSRLWLHAALFHVRYRDLAVQSSELIGDGFLTLTQNAAESEATGLELEGKLQLTGSFDIHFALGYIDVEISEVDEGVQGIGKGDRPALTPELTVSLSPRYVRDLPGGATLESRLDYYHRGGMFGQPVNTPLNKIEAVDRLNASLAWTSPGRAWSISLYGDNLTNEVYPLAKLDIDPTTLIINSNDRREYGIRISRRFGS